MMRTRSAIAALAGLCLLSGCNRSEHREAAPAVATESAPAIAPALPVIEPALDRKSLLLAILEASSNAALGKIDQEAQRKLDGKRFALRLRFGCQGPATKSDASPRSWRLDEKRNVQSFRIGLDFGKDAELVQAIEPEAFEAVEGFRIERPWLLEAACPQAPNPVAPEATETATAAKSQPAEPAAEPPASTTGPQIGIAQFFTETDTRTHRRDNRDYRATKALAEGELVSRAGYDLVISGRLRRLPDGRVIACEGRGGARPPDCIVSAEFEEVAIEPPGGGGTIAKWAGA